ncbi:WGR domain containing protein [uncultured Caudovirales phage]|uniref:WGR domain containing protein n=1 Tax=uncultured Caudovirales phage TaxID=2100421 RepID=A0A6J5S7J5_9CAUD|nr:WGR domain containing protein [uncultured Caudovirales phage]CAB4186305.1 WGR domain containing protein [uncultured Caudovirales phage]CAB4204445.1 WGR domain containing protein [uncultured Caudovirales phage]
MPIIDQIDLHYNRDNSDKVYHVAVEQVGNTSEFRVLAAYGRRGARLNHCIKSSTSSYRFADHAARTLANQKRAKGYHDDPGVSGRVFGATDRNSVTFRNGNIASVSLRNIFCQEDPPDS